MDKNTRVTCDADQWKVQERVAAGKGKYKWVSKRYYTRLTELMHSERERFERLSLGTHTQAFFKSKQAADHAWDAVDRLIKRHPEVDEPGGGDAD